MIGFQPVLLGVDGKIPARIRSVLIGYGDVTCSNIFHQCSRHNFEQLRNNNKKEFSLRYSRSWAKDSLPCSLIHGSTDDENSNPRFSGLFRLSHQLVGRATSLWVSTSSKMSRKQRLVAGVLDFLFRFLGNAIRRISWWSLLLSVRPLCLISLFLVGLL